MTREKELLRLVTELHADLRAGLVSARGKQVGNPAYEYLFQSITGLEQAVDGYILLTNAGKTYAAQLIVRTCLESYFRIQAVWTKPDLLYGIALHEHKEDLKFLKSAKVKGHDFVARSEVLWQSISQLLVEHFKETGIKDHPLDVYGAALAGGLTMVFDFQYRFFCNFTHATLRSVIGNIANLHSLSDRTIVICLFGALGAIAHIGGDIPDMKGKMERVKAAIGIDSFGASDVVP